MEFNSCPVCKSTIRVYESQTKKLIEQGLAPPNLKACLSYDKKVIGTKEMMDNQKVGDTLPIVEVATDVCSRCGCVYAVIVNVTEGTKAPVKPRLFVPGMPGGMPPGANNPMSS